MISRPQRTTRLFYSYSHRDAEHQDSIERALSLLRKEGVLADWSDRSIPPGRSISANVRSELDKADVICFLLSQHFIASDECMKEWHRAKARSEKDSSVVRIPIVLSDCAWKDLLRGDDLKALPRDGKSIVSYSDPSTAWQQVYDGLKSVIEMQRRTFAPRSEFLQAMEETDLISQDHISLSQIFVFPNVVQFQSDPERTLLFEKTISNVQQLLLLKHCVVHGDEMSGKSSLAKHVVLDLVGRQAPVMFIDLLEENRRPRIEVFRIAYQSQFTGDFDLWIEQSNKTIVFDNLTSSPRSIEYVQLAADLFDKIIVTVSSDVFRSFYRDDDRLAKFSEVRLLPLSHVQQEHLIRNRLTLMDSVGDLTDGLVDDVERRVNSAFAHKIVPRHPFYILAVIQTLEGFMPTSLSVTSYGHCYYVMVLARLTRCGISRRDQDINTCLNFAEHLALEIYESEVSVPKGKVDLGAFVERYRKSFLFPDALFSRLLDKEYGLISKDGSFRVKYMFHYFLGMFLSKSPNDARRLQIVDDLCRSSHVSSNHLTLMFAIHHSTDDGVLDKVVERTMQALRRVEPAKLNVEETQRFQKIVATLPRSILVDESVESKRREERERRDLLEAEEEDDNASADVDVVNEWYRVLKNNRILGQVLRNRCGNLKKERIRELIQTVADGGLRVVNSLLKDEKEISELASFLAESKHVSGLEEARKWVEMFSFLWTMINIEGVVAAISFREVNEVVGEVVIRNGSPAYDLIGYFSMLDSAEKLTEQTSRKLKELLAKHDDRFLRGVLSIRTQHYMNTHRSSANVEQAICSVLGIKYKQRLMEVRRRRRRQP